MTEYYRIEGLHDINFDQGATGPYRLTSSRAPTGLSSPLTRDEVRTQLTRLPQGIRGHALNRGMSIVTMYVNIQADPETGTDAQMESYEHDLTETLVDAALYIESQGYRGTRAVLRMKADGAGTDSYKTIYHGTLNEAGGRDVLGPKIKQHLLGEMILTLYCEPYWRPEEAITLGPNEVYCPGLEEDGNADGLADNWNVLNVPTCTMDSDHALQGFYCQKIVTRAIIGDGIQSDVFAAPAGVTSCIAYAWIARPAAGSDIIVEVYDSTAAAVRGSALYDTAGWNTELGKDETTTFYRVEVPVAAGIVPANNHRMRIYNTAGTATTLYVDKVFWLWDTTTVPDEWCDHWLIFNHYDTTYLQPTHEGHQNYFDVADLKGTHDARLLLRVEHEQVNDYTKAGDLLIARRSWWEKPSPPAVWVHDVHWYEGEDATTLSNWANLAQAACSGANCVTDAANVSGYADFHFSSNPGVNNWSANYVKGRYDVFVVVFTDDRANTQYRLSYTNLSNTVRFYNRWYKQPDDSYWQLLYVGEIDWSKYLREDLDADDCYFRVEYEKDAADTVRLDCIWLLRKPEPETRLHNIPEDWVTLSHWWVCDRSEDFDYEEKEYTTAIPSTATRGELCLQGDVPTVSPNLVIGQRLYFTCESIHTAVAPDVRTWQAHGAAHNLEMRVNIDYIPQYQTPLE